MFTGLSSKGDRYAVDTIMHGLFERWQVDDRVLGCYSRSIT